MERTICVWYPTWALRRPDISHDQPAQAIDDANKVVACNELASADGVTVGMARRSAEAISPNVVTVVADDTADMSRFEPVVATIEALIPKVEISAPGLMFIPIGGAVKYYGGEVPLVERIRKELDTLGGDHRMGLAAGPFAAYQAARLTTPELPEQLITDDEAFLASLDVGTLASDDLAATFRWLGITTLGALAELPKHAIIARFGRQGIDAQRLARGLDRTVDPRHIPEDPAVEMSFDPPINDMEQASFAARNLAQRLISNLATGGVAPHRVIVTATAGDGTVRSRTWRTADPFNDRTLADRVRWQLRAWIDGVSAGIRGGLVTLRLEPADLSGSGRQMALAEDAVSFEERQRAFMEVQAIAGADNLLIASPQGGRDPGQQVLWTRWGDEVGKPTHDPTAPWPGRIPSPAPALVPPEPIPFEISWSGGMPEQVRLKSRWVPVLSWAGPWRSVGRWWDGETPADRYQIVTSAGAYLCEIREGKTYLVGVYD
jgi:protein ImuB